MLCKDCGAEMAEQDIPRVLFSIGKFELWYWGAKDYACIDCDSDRAQEPERRAYDHGFDDGVGRGLELADRGR